MRFCFCEISRFIPSFTVPKGMHNSGGKKERERENLPTIRYNVGTLNLGWIRVDCECEFLVNL